jgi:hypothetical protein
MSQSNFLIQFLEIVKQGPFVEKNNHNLNKITIMKNLSPITDMK